MGNLSHKFDGLRKSVIVKEVTDGVEGLVCKLNFMKGGGGLWKAAGNSEPFKVSKGACHRARVQGEYVYTVFEKLTYGSGQP